MSHVWNPLMIRERNLMSSTSQFSRLIVVFVCSLLVASSPIASAFAQEKKSQTDSSFEKRLEKLDKVLEAERTKNKIPGLALAVVKDDKVVFAKGYGMRDLESSKPVESETRFAIGSSTKAFTGALIGMLVDEGKMSWDDPVSKHVPGFKLDIDTDGKDITLRDLLCHRSGFTRLSLLWASGSQSRSEVIKSAVKAKPYAKFREKFLYNNVMYMAAGVGAGNAAGSDWDSLIGERFFKPLGMTSSNTSVSAAVKDPGMSLGYMWDEDAEEFIHLPMRDLNAIAPAGAINSNVTDMARWIRFQLGKGEFGGKRLLREETHAETWKKQIDIAGEVGYGFGWMLRKWNGKKVVEHGGNIDGFGAQVSLLPEMNAGYVLLTNVTATPLQGASVGLVFDTLFGEQTEERGLAEIDTDELLGTYIANFGPFDDAKFEVKMKDGNLAVDVPGQTLYELKAPNDEGKWLFALTDTIAVSFNRKDEKVVSMSFYQGGMEPEFLREDYEPKPESPLGVTAPIVGKYRDEEAKLDIDVSVKKGRLVVNTGGRGVFTLLPPDEAGKWALRPRPDAVQITFNKNDDGTVKSMTRTQGGKDTEMLRISKASAASVPSVDELLGKMRKRIGAFNDSAGVRLSGTANFIHQGVTGNVETTLTADGKHATRQDFGKLATIVEAYDGKRGFSDASVSRFEELKGKKLLLMKLRHPAWFLLNWKQHYTDVSIGGETKIGDDRVFIVSFSGEGVSDRKLYVNAESGLVVKETIQIPMANLGTLPIDISYSDFRTVAGVTLPFKVASENPAAGKVVMQYDSAEELSSIPVGAFVVEPGKK